MVPFHVENSRGQIFMDWFSSGEAADGDIASQIFFSILEKLVIWYFGYMFYGIVFGICVLCIVFLVYKVSNHMTSFSLFYVRVCLLCFVV